MAMEKWNVWNAKDTENKRAATNVAHARGMVSRRACAVMEAAAWITNSMNKTRSRIFCKPPI
ncbi:hypothetical protein ABD86_25880 [Paenibacillus alvei]|nr:hypothetical protein [Paenibacillus alvei]MBG9747200.1 hypothetical protein [Paenibacillus alvei]